MSNRTLVRTSIDKIVNNAIVQTIASFVNFLNEQRYYNNKELKFLKKMPIKNLPKQNYSVGKFSTLVK